MRPFLCGMLVAFACPLTSSAAVADVTFIDTEMSPADWVSELLSDETPNGDGSFAVYQDTAIGAPAPSLRVEHIYASSDPSCHSITTLHRRPELSYDPAGDGAVGAIDFSFITIGLNNGPGWQFYAFQGGRSYRYVGGGLIIIGSVITYTGKGEVPEDFECVPLDDAPCTRPFDFSATGEPIHFGVSAQSCPDALFPDTKIGHLDNWQVTVHVAAVPVAIEINPYRKDDCFNVNGHGVVPVAVLGTAAFDVAEIDTTSLNFGAFDVRLRGNENPACDLDEINGDAFDDLVCNFEDGGSEMWEPNADATATLSGETYAGVKFEGIGSICVVP